MNKRRVASLQDTGLGWVYFIFYRTTIPMGFVATNNHRITMNHNCLTMNHNRITPLKRIFYPYFKDTVN
jgi:hypothetical protein